MYQAHCIECNEHFLTRSGSCPNCQVTEGVASVDTCAEKGCKECREISVDYQAASNEWLCMTRGEER